MTNKIEPIILGHNQFFGVNHLSADKAAEMAAHFSDVRNITAIIEHCMSLGVNGLMLSTHPHAKNVCEALVKDKVMREKLVVYPLLPYIAKYVRQANEKGIANVVFDSLKDVPLTQKIGTLFKGGAAAVSQDIMKIIETLIDFELFMFQSLNVGAIFLHQALTDLALGLDMEEVFRFYERYIPEKFGCPAAYCTYNLPYLVNKLKGWGIENPLVMASYNKRGFLMNPSLKANEHCLKKEKVRLVAMGTLASGFLKPKEAYEYLYQFPNVVSTVVGLSSKTHAAETFGEIRARSGRK